MRVPAADQHEGQEYVCRKLEKAIHALAMDPYAGSVVKGETEKKKRVVESRGTCGGTHHQASAGQTGVGRGGLNARANPRAAQ